MENLILCKVSGCRYAWTHITTGHKCGTCSSYGHGRIECGNTLKINLLAESTRNDKLPSNLHCNKQNCRYADLHTPEGHKCHMCGQNHSFANCLERNIISTNSESNSNSDSETQSVEPTELSGSITQFTDIHERISQLELPRNARDYFRTIINLTQRNKNQNNQVTYKNIKCPMCRQISIIDSDQKAVFGVSDKCVICFENNSQIFLNKCGHVCICHECFNKMSSDDDEL